MIVDTHVHFWDAARGDDILVLRRLPDLRRTSTPADLAPLLAASGIDRAIVVQAAPQIAETRYLLELSAPVAQVGGVVGWVDLRNPRMGAELDALRAGTKLRGVRAMLHRIEQRDWIAGPATVAGLAALASRDLALDLVATAERLDACRRALRAVPGLRAVLDHGGTPAIVARQWDEWAQPLAALARETGALCKLSGLAEEVGPDWTIDDLLPYAAHILECFGPQRVMAASNWPVVEDAGGHTRWWETLLALLDRLGVAADERAAILGGNAVTFYRVT